MCLIALALRCHPRFDLVLIANRDEFFSRPAAKAAFWADAPDILAGRDLEKGGTWLGVTRGGKFAAITNFREPSRSRADARSRGEVVARYLCQPEGPRDFLKGLLSECGSFNDFNLLLGRVAPGGTELEYFSTVERSWRSLQPGIYGLSNHLLDTPWPKVDRAKARLAEILSRSPDQLPIPRLFELLREDAVAPDESLPATGIGLEHERRLSPIFIQGSHYGTRCSTVVAFQLTNNSLIHCVFIERTYDGTSGSDHFQEVSYRFDFMATGPSACG